MIGGLSAWLRRTCVSAEPALGLCIGLTPGRRLSISERPQPFPACAAGRSAWSWQVLSQAPFWSSCGLCLPECMASSSQASAPLRSNSPASTSSVSELSFSCCWTVPTRTDALRTLWNSLQPQDRVSLLQVSWELHTDLKPLLLLRAIHHGIR